MVPSRRQNPEERTLRAVASERVRDNLQAYIMAAYNAQLQELEAEIEAMDPESPEFQEAVAFHEALNFEEFFQENKEEFQKILEERIFQRLWKKAQDEESVASPSPRHEETVPLTPSPQPYASEIAEPTSAILPASPSLPPSPSLPLQRVGSSSSSLNDCPSTLFPAKEVTALLDTIPAEHREETCELLGRFEALLIERLSNQIQAEIR